MTALQCILDACRTSTDGGWKVTVACGQDQVEQIAEISKLRDEPLFVVVMSEAEYHAQQSSQE